MLRRSILALAVLAPVVALASPRLRIDLSGTYTSNYGEVRLVHDGARVRGTYACCGGGTLDGRVTDERVIRYRWAQPGTSGYGVWTIGRGTLTGTWGTGTSEDDGGRWDLARATELAQ